MEDWRLVSGCVGAGREEWAGVGTQGGGRKGPAHSRDTSLPCWCDFFLCFPCDRLFHGVTVHLLFNSSWC